MGSFSLIALSGGCSLVAVCGLLFEAASLLAEQMAQGIQASVVATSGLRSCSSQALEHSLHNCDWPA